MEKYGGQQKFIGHIKTANAQGILTKKQAHDLKEAVNDACKLRPGMTSTSEAVDELDGKERARREMPVFATITGVSATITKRQPKPNQAKIKR